MNCQVPVTDETQTSSQFFLNLEKKDSIFHTHIRSYVRTTVLILDTLNKKLVNIRTYGQTVKANHDHYYYNEIQ